MYKIQLASYQTEYTLSNISYKKASYLDKVTQLIAKGL